VGYNNCKDVSFSAPSLFEVLQPELDRLVADSGPLNPQVHMHIVDLRALVETFLFHFSAGQNGEYVSQSKDLFYFILDKLDEAGIYVIEEIGGHSSVWAKRA